MGEKQPQERQKIFCNPDITWEEIEQLYKADVTEDDPAAKEMYLRHYGLSKALLSCYTMWLAKTLAPQNTLAFSLSPGLIATGITAGLTSDGKPPEEGTVSILHCLEEAKPEHSGWFYGSDAKRSPLHYLRSPGEPEYDGSLPW